MTTIASMKNQAPPVTALGRWARTKPKHTWQDNDKRYYCLLCSTVVNPDGTANQELRECLTIHLLTQQEPGDGPRSFKMSDPATLHRQAVCGYTDDWIPTRPRPIVHSWFILDRKSISCCYGRTVWEAAHQKPPGQLTVKVNCPDCLHPGNAATERADQL